MYTKMASAQKPVLERYIQADYLKTTDLERVQYRNPNYFIKPESVYVGGKCLALLSEVD